MCVVLGWRGVCVLLGRCVCVFFSTSPMIGRRRITCWRGCLTPTMVYVVVLFEQGFCDGCHGALSFGVRQHHVLLEPAESSLFQHHTALDRVTEL